MYRVAYGWFDGSQKPAAKTSSGSSGYTEEPPSIFFKIPPKKQMKGTYMTPEIILQCVRNYYTLIGTRYIIHIGRAGKHISFEITVEKEDCYHLMGLHYLTDRPDKRSRAKIFDDLLSSKEYRNHIASSELWTEELESRVICTSVIDRFLDQNYSIIRYNPKRTYFFSKISSEYLFVHNENFFPVPNTSVFLFVDKRNNCEEHFCKSIFPKKNLDYSKHQPVWTLLYKAKIPPGKNTIILYKHNDYMSDYHY